MTANILLHVLMRFIHIGSVILFLGGTVYARQVVVPALNALPEDMRLTTADTSRRRYQGMLFTLLSLILVSGLYNLLAGPKHYGAYHMWFGLKMLAVAHAFATAILWATSKHGDVRAGGRAKRRLISIAISGFIAVLISAYLRSFSLPGM